jgi:hypothetical protein
LRLEFAGTRNRSWIGLGNQEAAQEDAQAQAQENVEEDALGAKGARVAVVYAPRLDQPERQSIN